MTFGRCRRQLSVRVRTSIDMRFWTAVGPSGWDEALAFLGTAVTIVTDVVGLKTGYDALRALV